MLWAGGGLAVALVVWLVVQSPSDAPASMRPKSFQPRTVELDASGYPYFSSQIPPWPAGTSLDELAAIYNAAPAAVERDIRVNLDDPKMVPEQRAYWLVTLAMLQTYLGRTLDALETLKDARALVETNPLAAEKWEYTIIYFQGVTSLRLGEDENCIMCRGEGTCILPLAKTARHTKPRGSELAIERFTEYLERFPDDVAVRWLLNFAHMTLDQYPGKVDARHLLKLDRFEKPEFDIGRFRDVGALVGVNRLNFQGGGIMEDFDNDGRLDIVTTANHPSQPMSFFRNRGDGTFDDRTEAAGLLAQRGGLHCMQTDYNNDGRMDVFIPRGGWMPGPVRCSLLRNDGDGKFTDVTVEAGLDAPVNSLSACWADYDRDGHVDLLIPAGQQPSRLYRNLGNGTFKEVAAMAGVAGDGSQTWRSAVWLDYNRDGWPDLFVNSLRTTATLYRNDGDGRFTDVTAQMGIDGPQLGFACWAFDYDNDGWPDIFATCYDYPQKDVIRGLQGLPHGSKSNRLYRNLEGRGFKNVTQEAGLDMVFATMGCNFGDFDNDGWLDMFLGTGGPDVAMLVPSRMFKNVGGARFSEITGHARTGSIQKGHGVACGDWNRDGNLDIFIEMGGVTWNTRFHNMLYQNPGQGNNWLNLKCVGTISNRAAIGTRIEAITDETPPRSIHREVTSGSSFGANPMEVMIGMGRAAKLKELRVFWPASRTEQVFTGLAANRAIEITEGDATIRPREYVPIALPKE
jgi:hypothetical protein